MVELDDTSSGSMMKVSPVTDRLDCTPYRAVAYLGRGGVGEVVEATRIGQNARVAVKILHPVLASRPDFVARMRVHARTLERLVHPNLARVLDFVEAPDGRVYLVMERLLGRTLKDELRVRGALPAAEAIGYARQALSGLSAAHAAGLVHRDVKLANLFLCPAGRTSRTVKVLDFGVAKLLGRTACGRGASPVELDFPVEMGSSFGAPRCLSPEQVRGEPVDARTDVYAMGVVLYALLAGQGPFDHAAGAVDIAEAHAFEAPVPPSVWSPSRLRPELEAAVLRALEKDPGRRFASAAAFEAELARVASRLGRPTVWRDAMPPARL